MATQNDIKLLLSRNKEISISVSLLDELYDTVRTISGYVKSASYDISSTSNIRRTCSLTLAVPDKGSLNTEIEEKWIQRMVELRCTVRSPGKTSVEYKLGRMLLVNAHTVFEATVQEIKLSLVDLMASITADRGSQLGTDLLFPVGTSIKESIIGTVSQFSPYKRLEWSEIPEFEDTVPYDLTISSGKYPFDALKELLSLFPYYEMFYDVNGIFRVQEVPTKTDDPIDIDYDIIDQLLISEKRSVNFSNVKNTTEIWGKQLDAMYTGVCKSSVSEDGTARYNVTIDESFKELVVNETYSFTPDQASVYGQKLKLQETEEHPIYTQVTETTYRLINAGEMLADVHYVVKYVEGKFVLQGESLIHVIVQEIDEMPLIDTQNEFKEDNNCNSVEWLVYETPSPFACHLDDTYGTEKIQREIRQVLQGGEFDAIYTTKLALERASYENWLRTRLQDNVELEMIAIPWIDVNQKIRYTSPTTGELITLVTQSISFDFSNWTMNVKASKFYPYYPWLQ